jgi:hypothetical protein
MDVLTNSLVGIVIFAEGYRTVIENEKTVPNELKVF